MKALSQHINESFQVNEEVSDSKKIDNTKKIIDVYNKSHALKTGEQDFKTYETTFKGLGNIGDAIAKIANTKCYVGKETAHSQFYLMSARSGHQRTEENTIVTSKYTGKGYDMEFGPLPLDELIKGLVKVYPDYFMSH